MCTFPYKHIYIVFFQHFFYGRPEFFTLFKLGNVTHFICLCPHLGVYGQPSGWESPNRITKKKKIQKKFSMIYGLQWDFEQSLARRLHLRLVKLKLPEVIISYIY